MRNLTCLGGLFLTLVVGLPQLFAIEDDPSPWRVAPPLVKELSPADREARDDLLKLIEKKRDPQYRAEWILEIPERASGMPANYDVLLYRTYVGWANSATRIEIQVRAGRANLEVCDSDGIKRAELPAKEIDRYVRQLAYGFHATERERIDITKWSSAHATHVPYQTIEVLSRDEKFPCQLITPAWQAIASDIDQSTKGIRGYVHTQLADAAHQLARDQAKLLPEADESREILARLKRVPLKNTDQEDYLRDDLAAVEGTIYGHLAIERELAEALPELRRLKLKDQARHLEITTSANPEPLIKEAILAFRADSHLSYWAIDFAKDEQHPDRLQWLIDVLPNDISPYNAIEILEHLKERKLSKNQIGQIETLYTQTDKQIIKVCAAELLLNLTDNPQYFAYLEELIRTLKPEDKDNYLNPRRKAIGCLLDYSSYSGKQQERAYTVLKMLIVELETQSKPEWSELTSYATVLGSLGSPADLPYLTKLADSESPYNASVVINAIAKIEPLAALEVVHRRIERNNRSPNENYRWEVWEHLDLVMAERDNAAIPLLKQAWEWHVKQYSYAEQDGSPKWVIAFLKSDSPDERVDAALECVRHYYLGESQVKRIAEELRKEGADPEKCERLLQAYVRPPRGR